MTETDENYMNFHIIKIVSDEEYYTLNLQEHVEWFSKDGKTKKIYRNKEYEISRIEYSGLDYYCDINLIDKTYKKFMRENMPIGIESGVVLIIPNNMIMSEIYNNFQIYCIKDKLRLAFDLNYIIQMQVPKHSFLPIQTEYVLSTRNALHKNNSIKVSMGMSQKWVSFNQIVTDENIKSKRQYISHQLFIGDVEDRDIALPDLSEYTLIEN